MSGYSAGQLLFAWNWRYDDTSPLGRDEKAAQMSASSVFFTTLACCQIALFLSIRRSEPCFYSWFSHSVTKPSTSTHPLSSDLMNDSENASRDSIISTEARSNSQTNLFSNERKTCWSALYNRVSQHSASYLRVLIAICGAIVIVNLFNENSRLQDKCGTKSVSGRYWGIAIGWAGLCFIVDQLRKWIIIWWPHGWVAKLSDWESDLF